MRKRRKGKRECVRKFWRWREEEKDTWDEREGRWENKTEKEKKDRK